MEHGPIVHPQYPNEYKNLSYTQMKQLLQDIRHNPVRKSGLVYYCGMALINDHAGSLGDEIWVVYEQTLMAALDCNQISDAEHCWLKLADRFSKESHRVQRLRGLILESQEDWDQAEEVYKDILEDTNNCDMHAHKRQVAIAKAKGDRRAAISKLENYLAIYQMDEEAYHELAALHLANNDPTKACYCYEELILHDPHNYIFMLKLAEAFYSTREKQYLQHARKYFAQSIRLVPGVKNLRAYYGLLICCRTLALQHAMKNNQENLDVFNWTVSKLKGLYAGQSEQTVAQITAMLKMAKWAD